MLVLSQVIDYGDVDRDDDDDSYDDNDIDYCFLISRGTHGNPLGFLQHTKATIMQSEDATFLQQLGMIWYDMMNVVYDSIYMMWCIVWYDV